MATPDNKQIGRHSFSFAHVYETFLSYTAESHRLLLLLLLLHFFVFFVWSNHVMCSKELTSVIVNKPITTE